MRRGHFNIVAVVLLGMVLALGLAVFAHAITDRTVALPATTLSAADEPLAPARAKQVKAAPTRKKKAQATRTATTTATTAPTTSADDAGDDGHQGRGRGRSGSGDSGGSHSGSGGGSDNSGKGGGGDDD
jgi:hypothetical protein